ncbi:STAS domain-containing protein [Phaeobacter sp. J2-8]|uniref:STAS domain-containing protein n=1 Tax=Phaeobacter sp. J2-8 TaxID=2931394 RepID=UPI001FD25AF7|nr:STAS domain-containing protein [Phaeobacter sp. J2-8]MCJ7872010.1 STAS domain-containing protein [Phaeobacter sp. J2-8]
MTASTGASGPVTVRLAARLDFAACEKLQDDIIAARGRDLVLEAEDVQFLGGMAAELLLRARIEWHRSTEDFVLADPSDRLCQGFATLGIAAGVFSGDPLDKGALA